MSPCTRIASVSELPPEGELREFRLETGAWAGPGTVCIANSGGVFHALGNVCPHKGAPLSQGCIEDGKLVCAWHGWEFALSSGQCITHSGASIKVFELFIQVMTSS
jgi:nitrite reductase/ring-hydroxylating ferredoxin subunit